MDFGEIQKLIEIFEASGLHEIEVEQEGLRIRLGKGGGGGYPQPMPYYAQMPQEAPGAPPAGSNPAPTADAAQEGDTGLPDGQVTIDSPMVGTFYAASTPGDPPFVLPGDTVQQDKTVCIIEAMKIMNEVAAKFPCIVEKILVENGEPVEFGQPLFAVRPLA